MVTGVQTCALPILSQIVNDATKAASMAALYAVNAKIGDVENLPNSAADVVTAITQQNSNLETANSTLGNIKTVVDKLVYSSFEKTSVKISANSYTSVEFDIAKDGYEPIGMVGFTVVNSTCIVNRAMFAASSNKATIGIRNNTSSDTETTVRASILYKGK